MQLAYKKLNKDEEDLSSDCSSYMMTENESEQSIESTQNEIESKLDEAIDIIHQLLRENNYLKS